MPQLQERLFKLQCESDQLSYLNEEVVLHVTPIELACREANLSATLEEENNNSHEANCSLETLSASVVAAETKLKEEENLPRRVM